VAAAQDEALAPEDVALGVDGQIAADAVAPAQVVYVLQSVHAYGYELRLVVRRARRLGIPAHHARPEHVFLAFAHLLNVVLQFLVGVHGDVAGELFVAVDVGILVGHTPLCLGSLAQQALQHVSLYAFCLLVVACDGLLPFLEV